MADDRDDPSVSTPLHPSDLAALQRRQDERLDQLLAAVQRAPIRVPGPDDVPVPRGIDAYVIQETVRSLLDARVAPFLTRDQIERLVERMVNERMARIGLQMDDAHIEETGEAIRGAMRWHRLASRTLMGAAGTILLGAVYALARKAGLPVPSAS